MIFLIQLSKGITRNSDKRMRSFDRPHQDIGIDKYSHLEAVRIQIFAAKGFIGNDLNGREAIRPFLKLVYPLG